MGPPKSAVGPRSSRKACLRPRGIAAPFTPATVHVPFQLAGHATPEDVSPAYDPEVPTSVAVSDAEATHAGVGVTGGVALDERVWVAEFVGVRSGVPSAESDDEGVSLGDADDEADDDGEADDEAPTEKDGEAEGVPEGEGVRDGVGVPLGST